MNLIFGNLRYAELVRRTIEKFGDSKIDAFLIDKDYISNKKLLIPQITLEKIKDVNSSIFLGFTFENKKGPTFLENTYRRLNDLGVKFPGFDFSDSLEPQKKGIGTQIFHNSFIDFDCFIGRLVQIRSGVFIGHDTTIGDLTYIGPGVKVGSYVQIEEKCFLGFGCTITPCTRIGHNSLIGTGSVVRKDIPPYSVVTPDRPEGIVVKDPFQFL